VNELKQYFVFMCSKCRNFTLAPITQKSRRCSYCGSIIDIKKAAKALFETPETATKAVKEFNARGSDEFEKAVERSKERVKSLLPKERIEAESLDSRGQDLPSGKTQRLMLLLEREAKDKPRSLGEIEGLCNRYQLEWAWVEEQLSKLSNAGVVIFPRPWTLKLVPSVETTDNERGNIVDVSKEIMEFLRQKGNQTTLQRIVSYFETKGVSKASVESSLAKLLRDGEIFEPKSGTVNLV